MLRMHEPTVQRPIRAGSCRTRLTYSVGRRSSAMTDATVHTDDVTVIRDDAIRAFEVNVPQEALDDLRRRVADMRWPERETVDDRTQGVQLGTMQALARHWATDYDWRTVEARLQALPQFVTG